MFPTRSPKIGIQLFAMVALGSFWISGCSTASYNQFDARDPVTKKIPDKQLNDPAADLLDEETDEEPSLRRDTFTQASTPKVDLLWVIDSSGSMANEQQQVQTNATAFTSILQSANVDFKLMIITTDSSNDLMLQPRCGQNAGSVITPNTAGQFGNCALVGTNGSGYEEGLEAARRALDPAYPRGPWNLAANPAPLNSGFLRNDADLHIVFLSDEQDEESVASWRSSTDPTIYGTEIDLLEAELSTHPVSGDGRIFDSRYAYVPLVARHKAFFENLKLGTGQSVKAHSIVGIGTAGCTAVEVGSKYTSLANSMEGTVADICGDWNGTMTELGLESAGFRRCFRLRYTPEDPASMQATVNDDATTITYSPENNRACFADYPPPDAAIVITYY